MIQNDTEALILANHIVDQFKQLADYFGKQKRFQHPGLYLKAWMNTDEETLTSLCFRSITGDHRTVSSPAELFRYATESIYVELNGLEKNRITVVTRKTHLKEMLVELEQVTYKHQKAAEDANNRDLEEPMNLTLEELIKELQRVAEKCDPKLTLTTVTQILYLPPKSDKPAGVELSYKYLP